ncbi:hypothetical protein [Embleya sp. NPDC020630]|uniref:hypothetical protein n=1 Tax=Embleya sp. NPDC020630 TaxID=3363979 RepID=UPI0037AB7D56
MNASPTTGTRRYSKSVRRGVNSAHVVFAVGLLGIEWVMLAIAVVGRTTDDRALQHSAYRLMRVFVFTGGIPFAVLALVTGVLLCLNTPWGLWRYLWIKVKIVLLIAVIVAGAGVISQFAHRMIAHSAPDGNADALPPLQTWHIVLVVFQVVALIVATALSVFKPSGDRSRGRSAPRRRPGDAEDATAAADRSGSPSASIPTRRRVGAG